MDATSPFFSVELQLDALPESLRIVIEAMVQPASEELVIQAPNALERAAGLTFVFLVLLELLEELDISRHCCNTLKRRSGV